MIHRRGTRHWDICKFSKMNGEAGAGNASITFSDGGDWGMPEGSRENCTDREIVQAFVDVIEESVADRVNAGTCTAHFAASFGLSL